MVVSLHRSFEEKMSEVRGQDQLIGAGGGFSVLPNDAPAGSKLAVMKA